MNATQVIGAYLVIDLFVALPVAYGLLAEKHSDGEKIYPVTTIVLCMLWPVMLFAIGILYFLDQNKLGDRS